MRAVVQRVKSSKVTVDGEVIGSVNRGFNVLLGISKDDTIEDVNYIKDKIVNLRVFEDEDNKMNKSLLDIQGELLVISQFTLYGNCRKGRRPNFMEAMKGSEAEKLYETFLEEIKKSGLRVQCGKFGADMTVDIVNDGPVTILLDSSRNF